MGYPLKKDCQQTVIKFKPLPQGSCSEIDEPWEGETTIDRTAASKVTPLKRVANGVDHPETPTKKQSHQGTVLLDSESDEVPLPRLFNGGDGLRIKGVSGIEGRCYLQGCHRLGYVLWEKSTSDSNRDIPLHIYNSTSQLAPWKISRKRKKKKCQV